MPPKFRTPFSLKRMLVRLGIWLALTAGVLHAALVWWCASEIAEPARREITAAHRAYLDGSAKAGFTVARFESSDGMPCIVCTPEAADISSERAALIRRQLGEKGIPPGPPGEIIGTVMLLHGRAGMKEDYLPVAERFCAVGLRCVIPDLPGHGENRERFTTYGVTEAPMILRCYGEAAARFGFPIRPSALFGQSMGGAEAVHTAALEGSPFGAMVIVASFERLETVIRGQTESVLGSVLGAAVRAPADRVFGWKTGVRVSEINPMKKARGIRIPTLVVHGSADTMVPPAAGKALFDSFPASAGNRYLPIPGAAHNNVLITDYPLYAEMAEWFLLHLGPRQGG